MNKDNIKTEIFSKKFLVALLAISIFTNIIVLTKYNFPNILENIQLMFTSPPEVLSNDHIQGNPDAKITIIEYSDFQCYYCSQFHETMLSILKETDVRWIYRHFPLGSHEYAKKAAEAAECAGEQGKFWEYADALFAYKGKVSDEVIVSAAQKIKVNQSAFAKCLSSGKYTKTVAVHHNSGVDLKISGTPTFFLNGKRYNGYIPLDEFKKIIKDKLL